MDKTVRETIESRRSVRKYLKDPIPRCDIETIVEAARLAPSWCNSQCWRFIALDNPETIKRLNKPSCEGAPAVIVACALKSASGTREGNDYYMVDMGIAIEHMVLQAESMGYGTCWIGWFDESAVRKALGIPDEYNVIALLPVGKPGEAPESRPRKPLGEIFSWDKWQF